MKSDNTFGAQIATLRKSCGLTQRQLSELSGVNTMQLAKIERGVNSPSIDTLARIIEPMGFCVAIVPLSPSGFFGSKLET